MASREDRLQCSPRVKINKSKRLGLLTRHLKQLVCKFAKGSLSDFSQSPRMLTKRTCGVDTLAGLAGRVFAAPGIYFCEVPKGTKKHRGCKYVL